jgi:hypothetical protein
VTFALTARNPFLANDKTQQKKLARCFFWCLKTLHERSSECNKTGAAAGTPKKLYPPPPLCYLNSLAHESVDFRAHLQLGLGLTQPGLEGADDAAQELPCVAHGDSVLAAVRQELKRAVDLKKVGERGAYTKRNSGVGRGGGKTFAALQAPLSMIRR